MCWMPVPHRLLRSRAKLSQPCDPEAGSVHPAKWQGGAFRTALYDSLRDSQHRGGDRSRHQVVQSIRCFCHAGTFCQVLEPWDPLCTDPVQDHRCLELLLQRQDSCSSWLEQRSSGRSRRSSKHDEYCRVERFCTARGYPEGSMQYLSAYQAVKQTDELTDSRMLRITENGRKC